MSGPTLYVDLGPPVAVNPVRPPRDPWVEEVGYPRPTCCPAADLPAHSRHDLVWVLDDLAVCAIPDGAAPGAVGQCRKVVWRLKRRGPALFLHPEWNRDLRRLVDRLLAERKAHRVALAEAWAQTAQAE